MLAFYQFARKLGPLRFVHRGETNVTTTEEAEAKDATDDDKVWISAELEKVETKLLTGFHKWASPVEVRQRSHTAAIGVIDVEPDGETPI
jgi:hypothetical protein